MPRCQRCPLARRRQKWQGGIRPRLRAVARVGDPGALQLLASNIDSGLHSSLPLAYHEDSRIRTAFMQIMTNVLNQGTAFDELERLSGARKCNRLIDLVCQRTCSWHFPSARCVLVRDVSR